MLPLLIACAASSKPGTPDAPDTAAETAPDTGFAPFFDEPFEALDLSRWTHADWTLGATRLDAAHATVADGALELLHEADGEGGWLGAEIYTEARFSGGRWEAEMARPAEGGTVCATFFYGSDWQGLVNEVDIELLPGGAWFSVYRGWTKADGYDTSDTHDTVEWPWPTDFDPSALHVYRIDWAGDGLSFAVDGVEVGAIPMVPAVAIPLHINHWTSTTWPDVGYPPPERSVCRIGSIRAWELSGAG